MWLFLSAKGLQTNQAGATFESDIPVLESLRLKIHENTGKYCLKTI